MSQDFVAHMKKMQEHYKTEPQTMYALPIDSTPVFFGMPSRPPGLEQIQWDLQSGLEQAKATQQALIEDARVSLDSGDRESFEQKMNSSRERLKADVQSQIDHTYDRLTKIGKEHPGSRNAILQATNAVNALVNKAVSDIDNVFNDAFGSAGDIVTAPLNITLKSAEAVGNMINDALGQVGHAITSIFSGL